MGNDTVLRETQSVCPTCIDEVPATLVSRDEGVFLVKRCPSHGMTEVKLSAHPWYHGELDRYYFSVMKERLPQRDFLVRLTERCNLKCPICLASANMNERSEYSLEDLEKFMDQKRKLKIDLISAEPTVRDDLPDIIKAIKKRGHIAALHTNGIKLADESYCKMLSEAGCDEVHLQMDGFSDEAYMKIRGAKLTENKLKVLDNLQKYNLATDLVMVVVPKVNEDEIKKMLDFFRDKPYVRELFFLGLRSLGYARETAHDHCLTPDEVIDIVEEKSGGLITRKGVFQFQKLYFALLSLMGVRKCLYVQHYILVRTKKGYLPIEKMFNWDRVEKHLDRLAGIPRSNGLGRLFWFLGLGLSMLNSHSIGLFLEFLILKIRLLVGFDLSKLPTKVLILGFITACDPYIFDKAIAEHCGKGELSIDVGYEESGSRANIKREKIWYQEALEKEGKA
ncbi:MAG: radical SAM protein [Candidatus Eremiobacteraeota bacterium]|nr:radical SAM protein [Candidatus Eremiobacteraeota bacterium]